MAPQFLTTLGSIIGVHGERAIDHHVEAGRHSCIECPLHAGQFDVRTGEPISPPAAEPIAKYPVVIEDDTVYVDVPS